jgi:hypothetical protein
MRGVRSLFALASGSLLFVGCGVVVPSPGPQTSPPTYGGEDAATLRVSVQENCCYVEGAVEVMELSGSTTAEWSVEESSEARLAPGAYTLTAYEQVCNGNCGQLSPPSGHCAVDMNLAAGESVDVMVIFHHPEPCSVEVQGGS